jgi:hypothetical protein
MCRFQVPLYYSNPERFLKKLVHFTSYSKNNNVPCLPSKKLKKDLIRLTKEITYLDRYNLENKIARNSSLDDLNAVEFYSLVREGMYWRLSQSAGPLCQHSCQLNYLGESYRSSASIAIPSGSIP